MLNSNTPTKTALTVLVVGFALIMGACGQGDTDNDTTDVAAGTIPASPTTTAAPTTTSAPMTTTTSDPVATTTTQPSVPVTTTTMPPSQDGVEVLVYLFDPEPDPDEFFCEAVVPVTRVVDSPAVLTSAFEALLAGPNEEELEAGYGSWFSAETGWSVDSVTISDGVARIDFSEDSEPIPNASTSCGSMALRAQLDSTAMQFPTVERTVYSFGGDVAAFYHWLQSDVPEV